MVEKYNTMQIAQAIFTINKHAKTAPDNRFLYMLKKHAIQKLIEQKQAKKIGLHFVERPRNSQQQSSVLIACEDYYFHTLPEKDDFKELPHLGHLDRTYRNPPCRMSLKQAKSILILFTDMKIENPKPTIPAKKKNNLHVHRTSYFYGH